jgi:hypothetical protein
MEKNIIVFEGENYKVDLPQNKNKITVVRDEKYQETMIISWDGETPDYINNLVKKSPIYTETELQEALNNFKPW